MGTVRGFTLTKFGGAQSRDRKFWKPKIDKKWIGLNWFIPKSTRHGTLRPLLLILIRNFPYFFIVAKKQIMLNTKLISY